MLLLLSQGELSSYWYKYRISSEERDHERGNAAFEHQPDWVPAHGRYSRNTVGGGANGWMGE